jgi:enoyl-CoA hydratase/carnithine racemase
MGSEMATDVEIEISDRILHIRFSRPEKKNAITVAMYATCRDALAAARNDPAVRAILFSGEGAAFTAGNDLADFMQASGLKDKEEPPVEGFLREISTTPLPVVAAVQGAAVGVGVTMLLHCDIVFFAEDARLKTPFVDLGLVPEAASSLLLPALLGHHRAAAMLLLGETLTASEAVACGLGFQVVPHRELLSRAVAAAETLAAKAPAALRLTKELMKHPSSTVAGRMAAESAYFREQLQSSEAREAITAFLQKRPPNFG